MRLTKSEINTLKPGPRRFLWDDVLRGFCVRINKSMVSYMVDFTVDGKRRRVSLGSVHLQPLEKARERAAAILLAARSGTDATAVDKGDRSTFRAVWEKLTELDANKLAQATRL